MEIFIIIFLIIVNALFAMSELALVSVRKSRLEDRAEQGDKGAKSALELSKHPEMFLSTVQIGITSIGVIIGTYGGLVLVDKIIPYLLKISWLGEHTRTTATILVVGGIIYFLLLVGELVPKTIALNHPEKITVALASSMRMFSKLTYPLVAFMSFSTKAFLKLLMIKPHEESPVTEEELKSLIEKGSQQGVLEKQESQMMHSILKFSDRKAYSVMTPRKDVTWIDINDTKEVCRRKVLSSPYTKFPICNQSIDQIVGIITVKEFLIHAEECNEIDLRKILVEPFFIPGNMPATSVLELFREKGVHIAVVVDEYGSTEGLITLHDLIEYIVGVLPDSDELNDKSFYRRDDGSFLIEGSIQIEELKELLEMRTIFPNEGKGYYATLGGLVMYQLDKIPQTGDKFNLDGYTFEIVDMDGRRVDKVLVKRVEA